MISYLNRTYTVLSGIECEAGSHHTSSGGAPSEQPQSQMFEAWQASETRFRHLLENSLQGIVIHRDGHVLIANQAYAEMVGYPSPEALLKRDYRVPPALARLTPPEPLPPLAPVQTSRASGGHTCQAIRRDGSPILLTYWSHQVVWDGQSAVQSLVWEPTVPRQQTAAQQRFTTHRQQSQKMETIGMLTSSIAYEFNNLLTIMLGFTDLMQHELPSGHASYAYLQEVLTAGGRAKDLVRQLLTLSHPNEMERTPIKLHLLVKETLRLVRHLVPPTIELQTHVETDVGTVMASVTQLYQVLMNLCAHAVYAMSSPAGVLDIRLEALDLGATSTPGLPPLPPGPYARLSVRDTGPHDETRHQERGVASLFTTQDMGESTPMDLALVQAMVTGHGGSMSVDHTPGQGTTVALYLPRLSARPIEPSHTLTPSPSPTARILFVDDEIAIARLAQRMLTRLGYEALVYTNSRDALVAFRAAPQAFDLVITDQIMPVMTGEDLARELRAIRADIPIVLCTSANQTRDAGAAPTAGVDALLRKPLVFHDFSQTVAHLLAQRQANLP